MLHHLSWNRASETNTLAICAFPLNDTNGCVSLARASAGAHRIPNQQNALFYKSCPKFLPSDLGSASLWRKKNHFKSPRLLILKPALGLYLLSTWAYSLINWNKYTSSSDIHKDIGQPVYCGKYMLSHLFFHLIIHLPTLPGIISVKNTSYSLFIPQSSLSGPSLNS